MNTTATLPKNTTAQQVQLAHRFATVLHEWLTPDEMRQVVERNAAAGPNSQTCATGDFCDSNMAMDEAMEALKIPRDGDPDSNGWGAIWNAAWSIAKAADFNVETLAGYVAKVKPTAKQIKAAKMREGQFVLRVQRGRGYFHVDRGPDWAAPKDRLRFFIGHARVFTSLDNREALVAEWTRLLGEQVEAFDLPKINGLAVGDRVYFEDLEHEIGYSGVVDFIDPAENAVSVKAKGLRVYLRNDRENGRYFCPALKADAAVLKG